MNASEPTPPMPANKWLTMLSFDEGSIVGNPWYREALAQRDRADALEALAREAIDAHSFLAGPPENCHPGQDTRRNQFRARLAELTGGANG